MEQELQTRLLRFRLATAAGAGLVGLLGLAGWLTGSQLLLRVAPGLPPLAPISALLLIAAAAALALSGAAARALAALIGALGAAALLLGGAAPGPWSLGALPPPVGVNMLLGAASLLLHSSRTPWRATASQWCALLLCLNSVRSLLGMMPAVSAPLQIDAARDMSLHGTVAMLLLGLGLLAARGDSGFMALALSPRPAGRLLRRLSAIGVALPLLIAVLTTLAWRAGVFGAALGIVILIFGNLLIFYCVAAAYGRADSARRAAEARLALANAELERRVAERTASLEEREAQLRAIGDNLPGAWIYSVSRDPEGPPRFQYLSAGVAAITGHSPEAVLARPGLLYELIHPDHRERYLAHEAAARAGLAALDVEVRKLGPGGVRWSRIRSHPRRLPDGQVVWDGIEIDITAQKEAGALIERDRRYQAALFACSRALLPAADTPAAREAALAEALGHLHGAAQASRTFLMRNIAPPDGPPAAELVAEVCAPGVPPSAAVFGSTTMPLAMIGAAARAAFAAGHPLSSDGQALSGLAPELMRRLEASGVRAVLILPLHVAGRWWGIVGLHACDEPRAWDEQETTLLQTGAELIVRAVQRWDDEDELRRREALLSALFDILPVGVSITNSERRPQRLNRAISQIAGMDVEEMLAGSHSRLRYIRPDGSPYPNEEFPTIRAIRGEVVRDAEVGVLRPDGQLRWVSMSAVHLPMAGQSAAVVSLDITERKRVEAERLALERTLLEAQRLESLGVLAGGVAHDFNNLLTTILGHAELAALEIPPASPAAVSLGAIAVGARRAADLTAQMLAYAGRGRFVSEPVLLNELAVELGALTRASLAEAIALEYALAPALPPIIADATQVRQVLLNLITNAAEAIGAAGGQIRISTGLAALGAAELAGAAFSAAAPGPHCFLEVADSGPGIAPATMARIFDPFFSTKFTGRGLGLAAVQGIIRAHGGALFVQSAPGGGAVFRACFAAAASTAPAPAAAVAPW